MQLEQNKVIVNGIINTIEFDHEVGNKKMYKSWIDAKRLSERVDHIPVLLPEKWVDIITPGETIEIAGSFRSHNKNGHLMLNVLADEVTPVVLGEQTNEIALDGYICKMPVVRDTPLGRRIADLLLAVNRPCGRSDYIPCIAWGRNADYCGALPVGTRIKIVGRIQSRTYIKEYVEREVYEVSISNIREV